MSHRKTANRVRRGKVSKLRVFLLILLSGVFVAIAAAGVFVAVVAAQLPQWDPSALSNLNQSSIVYDQDGHQIAELHASTNRLTLTSNEIPDLVKKTFVAVEDKRFYQNMGIDPIRIVSAAFQDIISRSAKEGASTITQQLAKNAFIQDPTAKTLTRKVQEALLALQLEHRYTKDQILTFYLNKIPLGESAYGIEAAAQTYFGKDVNQLDPAEVALLAGLPQAPSGYDPYYHPQAAKNRRDIVLGVMHDAGIITSAQYTQYKNEPFTYVDTMEKTYGGPQKALAAEGNYQYPSFVDYVVNQLEDEYNLTPDQIFNGGLKIYTTVDPKIQAAAEKAFNNPANFPKSVDNKTLVQGAMTVIDPTTGAIVAMEGGRNYTFGDFDRAWQAKRQPGSTIKPLVDYGPALDKGGYYPGTVLDDMPVTFDLGNGQTWSPIDYDTSTVGWKGLISMRYALEDSVNVYAVKLLSLIGVDTGWEFGKKLGLPLTNQDKVLSLALGTAPVSTLDMASAFEAFDNNGLRVTPHAIVKVVDAQGDTIVTPQIMRTQVMKPTTAYLINDMLRSVVTDGTAYAAKIGDWAVAGKTGTTSLPASYGNKTGNPDAWFVAYTPDYVGVVWMGYDSDPDGQHYLRDVYGGSYPAQIWKQVMTVALEGKPVQTAFYRPPGIVSGQIDTKSGLLPSPLTPPQFIKTEIAAAGDFPTKVSTVWVQGYVDPKNPNQPVSPDDPNKVAKVFLNIPDRDPSWRWPPDEAPYRPPANAKLNLPSQPD